MSQLHKKIPAFTPLTKLVWCPLKGKFAATFCQLLGNWLIISAVSLSPKFTRVVKIKIGAAWSNLRLGRKLGKVLSVTFFLGVIFESFQERTSVLQVAALIEKISTSLGFPR